MRKRIWFGSTAVLAAILAVMTACSSSGGTATGSSSTAVGSSGSPTLSGGVAQAKANVAAAENFPTTIPVTDPLPSKPPTGKTIVFLQCEEQSCPLEGQGLQAAARTVGWNVKILNFQAVNPATLVTALKTALQYHPVATVFSGVPQDVWKFVQPAYKVAGAVIIPSALATEPTGEAVLPGRNYAQAESDLGSLLADAVIANADGEPAESLLVSVPAYTVYLPLVAAYKDETAKLCPGCKADELDLTLPQLQAGDLDSAVVSAVKRNPSIKYIVSVNGAFIDGLPDALKSAGLEGRYKIVSGKGASLDQQNVLDGKELETVNSSFLMAGWQDMDEAIRYAMGLPIPAGDHRVVPLLLTKDNIGTPADSYDRPIDYAAQFEKLWLVN
jgi:ribose transport system substrate-binding protein